MKRKYKIIIVICILILIIILGITINNGIKNNSNLLLEEIYINEWNDYQARYLICRADVNGEPAVNFDECQLSFSSSSERSDIVNTNKKAYIGEITYYNTGLENQASLFYEDDNYYVLYYNDYFREYVIKNCYMSCNTDYLKCRMPCPVPIEISYGMFEVYHGFDENHLDYLYDNYTFADAVEFYERISKDYVSIDKEKQQITLDGFDVFKCNIIEKCLTLDFKNRTVIVKTGKDSKRVLDGTEQIDDF